MLPLNYGNNNQKINLGTLFFIVNKYKNMQENVRKEEEKDECFTLNSREQPEKINDKHEKVEDDAL